MSVHLIISDLDTPHTFRDKVASYPAWDVKITTILFTFALRVRLDK